MRTFIITILVALTALAAGFAVAGEPVAVRIDGVDAHRVTLFEPVTRVDASGKPVTHSEGYLVRVLGSFPVGMAIPVGLYFGDKRIEEYGGFAGGLYFVIVDRAELDALADRPIRAVAPNGVEVRTDIRLSTKGLSETPTPIKDWLPATPKK